MNDPSRSALYDDADLYDRLHAGYRDDVDFYRRLALDQGGPVIELGAGSGRLTAVLARTGLEIVAVEPHPAMRARCEARLADLARDEPDRDVRVRVVAGDARTLELDVRAALVIAPFNTLMHLERLDDQDAALSSARAHLAPGGAFACDLFVPRFGAPGVVRSESMPSGPDGLGGDLLLWQEHDEVEQVITTQLRLDTIDDDGRLQRRAAVLRQRYWTRFELERALASAGFRSTRLFGDLGRGPFTAASTVMAAVARI
ncbi:class I SAM-dependent methyltransferase [soil metagenome]|nr:class I SAM-dependent methyltransferase [Trueperaceae bacterium]